MCSYSVGSTVTTAYPTQTEKYQRQGPITNYLTLQWQHNFEHIAFVIYT